MSDMVSHGEPCPPDRCFACWYRQPRQGGHEADLMDLRTGRRFCHEHMAMLVTWELDDRPGSGDIAEWSGLGADNE